MSNKTTRRNFVKTSAAVSTAFWVGGQKEFKAEDSPVERLNVACIGVQGKGGSDSSNAARGAEIVGLCDIDTDRLDKKSREFPKAEKYVDYREMLSELGDKIDAVTVSTPDHSHAPAAVMAMKMGKHVYVQKPMTWSIFEARTMRETAKKMGVVTQMGNQGTSSNGLREGAEIIKSGGIGDVTSVHVWTNRPVWPQGNGRPEGEDPIPKNINWDLFLGPAPERPYKHDVYMPFKWRGWVDFGTGALGDMACHTFNLPCMAADLFDATSFEAIKNTGVVDGETYPRSSVIKFEFPKRGEMPECLCYWYDGGEIPGEDVLPTEVLPESIRKRVMKDGRQKILRSGSLLVGTKGMLYSPNDYGEQTYLLPEKNFESYEKPEPFLPRCEIPGSTDQRQNGEWIAACKGEGKTMSNFDYAGRLTETILAGNLAIRAGEKVRIEWDAKNMKVTNNDDAQKFVHREYRSGWTL